MKKLKLLSAMILSVMFSFSANVSAENIDDIPDEEFDRIATLLEKDQKSANARILALSGHDPERMSDIALKLRRAIAAKTAAVYQEYAEEINRAELYAGNPEGDIILVEFLDFSCGYCHQMAPHIKNIIEKNPDVKVIFKPLSIVSPKSKSAAKAFVAANNQGRLLEMYSGLMSVKDDAAINKLAQNLELDMAKFKKDYASNETRRLLRRMNETADKAGIKGFPTLILNGMPLFAKTEREIQQEIDALRNGER